LINISVTEFEKAQPIDRPNGIESGSRNRVI